MVLKIFFFLKFRGISVSIQIRFLFTFLGIFIYLFFLLVSSEREKNEKENEDTKDIKNTEITPTQDTLEHFQSPMDSGSQSESDAAAPVRRLRFFPFPGSIF